MSKKLTIPSTKSLLAFHAVCEYLSFTRAAEALNLTHSAISHSIKGLEEHLGQKLFHRENKSIHLTQAGEAYYNAVKPALEAIHVGGMRLRKQLSRDRPFKINMLTSFAMHWLIPQVAQFTQAHPDIKLRLASMWQTDIAQHEAYDLSIYYGPCPSKLPKRIYHHYAVTPLFPESLMALASPAMGIPTPRSIESIVENWPFVYVMSRLREDNWTILLNTLGLSEPPRSARVYFQNTIQALEAAVNGMGLIAGQQHFLMPECERGELIRVLPEAVETDCYYYLVHPKSRHHPALPTVKSWLLDHISI